MFQLLVDGASLVDQLVTGEAELTDFVSEEITVVGAVIGVLLQGLFFDDLE